MIFAYPAGSPLCGLTYEATLEPLERSEAAYIERLQKVRGVRGKAQEDDAVVVGGGNERYRHSHLSNAEEQPELDCS